MYLHIVKRKSTVSIVPSMAPVYASVCTTLELKHIQGVAAEFMTSANIIIQYSSQPSTYLGVEAHTVQSTLVEVPTLAMNTLIPTGKQPPLQMLEFEPWYLVGLRINGISRGRI
jgi:uroporphyrinogen-III decarboxylase